MEEANFITLVFDNEDGTEEEVTCEIVAAVEVEGQQYVALDPQDDSEDIFIYAYSEADGEMVIEEIADDDLFEKVLEAFDKVFEEGEEEDAE